MVNTIKFSQMTDGGDIDNNKKVPGLKQGDNVLFNNPWTFLPPGDTASRPTPSAEINYRLRFNTEEQLYEYYDAVLGAWTQLQESAFTQGPFLIYKADPSIPDGQNLGALANGILKQTITAGSATLDIAVLDIDYYGPGMTGYLQAPAGVRDVNGNIMLQFQPVPSAVNYIALQNSDTGNDPGFNASGTDTNVGIGYAAKGSGLHKFYSLAEIPFEIHNGTGYQRVSQFRFEDVSGGFTYTFPQATGTIALTSGVATSIEGTANQVLVNGTSGSPVTGDVILTTPQDIGTTSSPTFANVEITNSIRDSNGNTILLFAPVINAVNYFAMSNVGTGSIPVFAAVGSDTDVSMGLNAKGAGVFNLKSAALTNQFQLNLGASYDSVINHNYPSNTNTRTYTWQDASGTVAFLSDIPSGSPSALTKTNDTNVTLTLGGTPNTALLQAVSLTLGWTGTLAPTRGGLGTGTAPTSGQIPIGNSGGTYTIAAIGSGTNILVGNGDGSITIGLTGVIAPTLGGTGVNNGANTLTLAGTLATSGAFASTFTMTGATNVTFPTSGTLATTSQIPTGAALTKTDDTNVTLTLGGSPTTALINATSLTLGWTGQLGLTRGGTAASLTASNGGLVYSTASALAILSAGSTGQIPRSGGAGAPTWSTATYPATAGTSGNLMKSDGTNWNSATFASLLTAPTQQRFTSGTGTYTTPTSPAPLYIRVRMVAGGGGGSGSGTGGSLDGGAGGNTTFGSSLLTCNGGGAGTAAGTAGAGGTASISSPAYGTALSGAYGDGNSYDGAVAGLVYIVGGGGGDSPFGGGGGGGAQQRAGNAGTTNTGGGGGGGGGNANTALSTGSGGGSGGFIDAIIPSPSASYSYAIGAAGTAGSAGTNGFAGAAGGSGYIEVTEYYQ